MTIRPRTLPYHLSEGDAARNLEVARALNPALQSFDAWLAQYKTRIPLG